MKTRCMICQSSENVLELWGYFDHQQFTICKTCARLASTLHAGDLLDFGKHIVYAVERTTKSEYVNSHKEPNHAHL